MKKILALTLWFATLTATADEVDKRQILPLTEHQRNHVLTEMRDLLSGTQNILGAISREDMIAVAGEARSLGMGMVHKGEDHLQAVLPREFTQLGMSVHKSFDKIALDAESLKDLKHTLRQLTELMQKCNACHSSYQIRVKDEPADSGMRHSHHQH
ncbi:cytochrome c [Nitrosovibrio tenuis]|uniref:Cytochrome C n=1 Tax=Nitrosovibrio tenuis TaxID=1233 RepID=A0A1H7PZX7_9PROT|nr:cytochrome c [Nitrosovibrio tenuis]SEL41273.1 Cytochrome C' [Nitrosovibrio tenuis]